MCWMQIGKTSGKAKSGYGVKGNAQQLFEPKGCTAVLVQALPTIIQCGPQDFVARKTGCKPTTSFVHNVLPIGC